MVANDTGFHYPLVELDRRNQLEDSLLQGNLAQQEIAAAFVAARNAGASVTAFPGAIPGALEDAYRVQDYALAAMGLPIGGWKVGRIFPPLSDQFRADRLAGPILRRLIQPAQPNGQTVGKIFRGGFGAAEAEYLLRLGTPPPPGKQEFTLEEAAELVDAVHVGLEIASSPLATINQLGPPVIVSDFGNNNGLIVGPEVQNWRTQDFADWTVTMSIDGVEVGQGTAAAFPSGPIGSVKFLLELMARRGIALPSGTWVSSGAISGVHDVHVGQVAEARFGDRFSVSCRIEYVAQEKAA